MTTEENKRIKFLINKIKTGSATNYELKEYFDFLKNINIKFKNKYNKYLNGCDVNLDDIIDISLIIGSSILAEMLIDELLGKEEFPKKPEGLDKMRIEAYWSQYRSEVNNGCYITIEQAIRLKDLGFNPETNRYYDVNQHFVDRYFVSKFQKHYNKRFNKIAVVTKNEAIEWLFDHLAGFRNKIIEKLKTK